MAPPLPTSSSSSEEGLARAGTGRRRATWSVCDQALSSVTNFGLAIVVARATSTEQLGAFELAFSLYLFAIGCSRALSSEPLLVRYSDRSRIAVPAGQAVGTALVVGVVAGAACLVFATAVGGDVGPPIAALGVALPGLLVQDAWRYVFFAAGRPAKAVANDLVWGVVQFAIVAWLVAGDDPSVALLVAAWGTAAGVGAVVGMGQARVLPRPLDARRWLVRHRDLGPRFFGEFAIGQGAAQVAIWVIGLVGGLAVLGALRAGLVLIGPVRIFLSAAPATAIPELIRIRRRSAPAFERLVRVMSGALAGLVVVWAVAVLAAPARLGEAVLGDNWAPARRLFPVLALGWAVLGLGTGAMVGLRVLADARRSLRARLIICPFVVLVPPVSVVLGGSMGAAIGLAVVSCWTAAVWWAVFRQADQAAGSEPRGEASFEEAGGIREGHDLTTT